jgi:hypothetical protein
MRVRHVPSRWFARLLGIERVEVGFCVAELGKSANRGQAQDRLRTLRQNGGNSGAARRVQPAQRATAERTAARDPSEGWRRGDDHCWSRNEMGKTAETIFPENLLELVRAAPEA